MALKGYLQENAVCVITTIIYEKISLRCTAHVDVFSDINKTEPLASFSFAVMGEPRAPEILTLTPQKVIPEDVGDSFFLIDAEAEGELQGYEGRLACIHQETGSLQTYIPKDNSFLLYVKSEEQYKLFKQGEWVELPNHVNDKRVWDKWLAPEVAFAEGTNPTKQMYKLMKTLKKFKNCVDV